MYPLQGACIAALDMFKQMVHELAEMRTEKRACDENILELATKHSHEAAKVHRHEYVHLRIATVSTVYVAFAHAPAPRTLHSTQPARACAKRPLDVAQKSSWT